MSLSVSKYLECADEGAVKPTEDKITPMDSISNVDSATTCSTKGHSRAGSVRSKGSNKSSISVVRVQVEAKRAALLARAESLKQKHELETKAESLHKQMEQMDLETEIEAAEAEMVVLQAFSAEQDGMDSYFEKRKLLILMHNPRR